MHISSVEVTGVDGGGVGGWGGMEGGRDNADHRKSIIILFNLVKSTYTQTFPHYI